MAAASTDWISHCRSNRADRGTIFRLDDDEFAEISKGHCDNVKAFRSTIANSGGGNFLLIPGSIVSCLSSLPLSAAVMEYTKMLHSLMPKH
jgi:hypothetical protein